MDGENVLRLYSIQEARLTFSTRQRQRRQRRQRLCVMTGCATTARIAVEGPQEGCTSMRAVFANNLYVCLEIERSLTFQTATPAFADDAQRWTLERVIATRRGYFRGVCPYAQG
jgi:hypothetical protein